MSEATIVDAAWLRQNPLPPIGDGLDKEARGRVLVVGGAVGVPGAIRLTGEAALRVGAGKLQLATVAAVAIAVGVLLPEAAMIALPGDEEGEIAQGAPALLHSSLERCGAVVLGPGMCEQAETPSLLGELLRMAGRGSRILLDAGALTASRAQEEAVRARGGTVVMTPHPGELARLLSRDKEEIERDPVASARDASALFQAVIVLKSDRTLIVGPDGAVLRYVSSAPGLGTSGSGDVLAGAIGGLLARGCEPLVAAGWGVWLHGEAGKAAASRIGPLGFLARDLAGEMPALMAAQSQR